MNNRLSYLFFIILSFAGSKVRAQKADSSQTRYVWILDRHEQKLPAGFQIYSGRDSLNSVNKIRLYILKEFYDSGYFSGSIDSIKRVPGKKKTNIVFYTQKKDRFLVGNIFFKNEVGGPASQAIHKKILHKAALRKGDHYSSQLLQSDISRIIHFYEDEGYPLIKVTIQNLDIHYSHHSVDIYLKISPGTQMLVSGVIIHGVKKNDPNYIAMITGIKDSTLITPHLMKMGKDNLQNSDYFSSVSDGQILEENGNYYVSYDVQEKNTNAFNIILGYVPKESGSGGIIVGNGDLLIRNAIWNGSSLNLSFDRVQRYVTKLRVGYQRNWLFHIPFSLGGRFHFLQQDSAYQTRDVYLTAGYNLNGATQLSAGIHQQSVSTNNNYAIPIPVYDGNSLMASIGINYQSVDNILVPRKGLYFSLNVETGYKRLNDQRIIADSLKQRFRQQSIQFYFQPYFNPFRRQVLTFSLHGYFLDSGFYTLSDLIRFGGAESIRGYREDQFQASRMLWGDVEYRYLLDPTSYAFIFGAEGTYLKPRLSVDNNVIPRQVQWLHSYGFGFAFQTKIGQLKFSYAKSPQVSFSNGLVHFSIKGNL